MKTSTILSVAALAASIFVSCNKDNGDTTKPVINLIEPEDGDELLIGGEHGIHFEMEVSDNEALASYKIDIHNNFDHHGHSKADDATVAFTFSRTYNDIAGKKNATVHHHDILIPANATPGDYHLVVYCTDAAGNESYVARDIVLSLTTPEHDHDED